MRKKNISFKWSVGKKQDNVGEGNEEKISRVCDNLGQIINQLLIYSTSMKHLSRSWEEIRLWGCKASK